MRIRQSESIYLPQEEKEETHSDSGVCCAREVCSKVVRRDHVTWERNESHWEVWSRKAVARQEEMYSSSRGSQWLRSLLTVRFVYFSMGGTSCLFRWIIRQQRCNKKGKDLCGQSQNWWMVIYLEVEDIPILIFFVLNIILCYNTQIWTRIIPKLEIIVALSTRRYACMLYTGAMPPRVEMGSHL